ncbi:MAG: hypothetical protein JNK58_01220, partial [Phycisphaerae bacterium]|nr:hypothetical protein [Phycisphaerae bacterium]
MKIKGINPLERHVEKFVLGVFALFVLAVLLMQTGLVGGGRMVRVGSSERPIDQAIEGVKELALQRQARLQSDQVAPAIPASMPDPARVFEEAFARSTTPVGTLAALGQPALRLGDAAAGAPGGIALPKGGDIKYAAMKVSKPSTPIATVFEGTIDPIEVAEIGSPLASHLPAAQPFDLRAPSIEATFDAEALRKSIESPTDEGVLPLPPALWQGKVELVDVEWFRQQLGPDGRWGQEEMLPALPGRPTPRDVLGKSPFQPADYREALERERLERLNIRRPMFYATISGQPWVWPSQQQEEATAQGAEDVTGLKRELASVRAEIDVMKKRLERLGQGPRRPPGDQPNAPPPGGPPPKGPGGGGGGRGPSADAGGASSPEGNLSEDSPPFEWPVFPKNWYAQVGGGGGGGGAGGGGTAPPEGPSPEERRKERDAQAKKALEDKIARFTKREQELVEQLAKKGVGDQVAAAPTFLDEPLGSLASAEMKKITLWSLDLSATSGSTYR